MEIDAVATATVRAPRPIERELVTRPEKPAEVGFKPKEERAVLLTPHPRRVELSYHEDLKVLMTRVVDVQTGALVREYPIRQVLDMVADVMARIRAREGVTT